MNKQEFHDFLTIVSEEEIKEHFYNYGIDSVRTHYKLSFGNLKELVKLYDLRLSKEQVRKKKQDTWKLKSQQKTKILVEKVSRESLTDYYLTKNNTFEDTKEYFNITDNELLELLKIYDCRKDKKLSAAHTLKTKCVKYGDSGYNNRNKAKETCLERYGVDNPFKDIDNMRLSYIRSFGVDHPMRCDEIVEKQHRTWISNSKNGFFKAGALGRNSIPNREFEQFLSSHGLIYSDSEIDKNHFSREFCLGRYSYDFRIDNYLIEVNPTVTHNSSKSIFGRDALSKDYHFKKSLVAWNKGFCCIHLWDWDDKELVYQKIISDEYLKSKDNLDKALYKGSIESIEQSIYYYDVKLNKLRDCPTENTYTIFGVGKLNKCNDYRKHNLEEISK